MAEEPKHEVETDKPSETPTRQIPGVHVGPPTPESELDPETHEALQMKVSMKIVGSVMVFIGFIQVFLSVSTGAEITAFPMILYFVGLALWAHSSVKIPRVRYLIIAFSLVCALGFFQLGEVLLWHKYVVYWGTIAMVVFFMFQNPKKPSTPK
ncbi:MAG: hypothetical protein ACE1ZK_05695 [Nitrospirales bacterium]